MRKILTIILALVMVIGLFGCGEKTKMPTEPEVDETQNTRFVETEGTITEGWLPADGARETESTVENTDSETNIVNENSVYPLPPTTDLDNLEDCTLSVVIMKDDVFKNNGVWQMSVEVCDYERFDAVDVANLDIGKILVINGFNVSVNEVERNGNGTVIVNGGVDNGGYELVTNENGVYYSLVHGFKTYYDVGEIVLDISPDFVYVNASNPNEDEIIGTIEDLSADINGVECFGTPHDTTIVVENGVVVELRRGETKYLNCSCEP